LRNLIAVTTMMLLTACGGAGGGDPTPVANGAAVDAVSTPTPSPTGQSRASAAKTVAAATPGATLWGNEVRATTRGGYLMGNPDARIKLVEYGSRTCPACARFTQEAMRPLVDRYVSTGRVSYEFRDFIIHGGADIAASLVGQCGRPSTFFPVLEATFAAQKDSVAKLQSVDEAQQKMLESMPVQKAIAWMAERGGYVAIAERNGVPAAQTARCLNDAAAAQRLVDRTNSAKGINSTPSFEINGRILDAHDWKGVEAELRKAGA
jgi:protein-disulfide isomerase